MRRRRRATNDDRRRADETDASSSSSSSSSSRAAVSSRGRRRCLDDVAGDLCREQWHIFHKILIINNGYRYFDVREKISSPPSPDWDFTVHHSYIVDKIRPSFLVITRADMPYLLLRGDPRDDTCALRLRRRRRRLREAHGLDEEDKSCVQCVSVCDV